MYVAGHGGLVGSAVWRHLEAQGFTDLVGRSSAELDLRERDDVLDFFAKQQPEYVVLAAARVGGIMANATQPAEFLSDNLRIQLNVLDAAAAHGVQRLLFLGSSCIYPRLAPQPISESALLTGPLEPTNEAYAIAKIAGVLQVQALRRQHGLSYISAMPTNLYGPGDNFSTAGSHVLPALVRRFDEAKRSGAGAVTLWGTGTPRREFLHVDDLARACLLLLERYDDDAPVNVGTGTDLTIAELATLVARVVGYEGSDRVGPDQAGRHTAQGPRRHTYPGTGLDGRDRSRAGLGIDLRLVSRPRRGPEGLGDLDMDLRDYGRILRKRWLSIVLCMLLGGAAAVGVSALQTPVYEAQTQLFVSAQSSSSNLADAAQGGIFTQQRVKSYAQIVTSPDVLQPVIDRLGLTMTPDKLANQITASAPLDTVLINVAVDDTSAQRAMDIANAVSTEFTSQVLILETPVGGGDSPVKVTVVKQADKPLVPVSPRTKVNLALGLLLGLAVGIGIAVFRETLDTTIKRIDDLARVTGAGALGMIAFDSDAAKHPLITAIDPSSTRSESFRTLRTNLQFVDIDRPPRTVVITSAVAGEGKSTTACNLAITLAQAGIRVALVESDLRRPKIAEYLGVEGSVGLTSVLIGRASLDDALQTWGRCGLAVLASGPIPPNPSELLGSGHMVALLRQLQQRFDVVIIDAPPLLPVTDAAVLSRICDGAVLVVRYGKTRREQLERTAQALHTVDARILGTVMNMAPTKGPDAYAYGYGYSYAYKTRTDRPRMNSVTAQGDVLPDTRVGRRAKAGR